jgi:PAS domain S-box-containing protein
MSGIQATILVVDDEPESLRLLTDILAAEGYEVCPADSGELALAAIRTEPPELILLDIHMRGMDGFEVCRRIKAFDERQEIPLVFMSAATDAEERVEGLSLGAVDFVSKPFQRGELLARVRTHLELGRLRTQLEKQVASQTATLRAAVERLQFEAAERKRTEMALRESEERFRATFSQAAVGITQTAIDGKWLVLNDRLCEILGYTQAELRGKTFLDITHPDDREVSLIAVRRLLAGEMSSHWMDKRYIRKDGSIVWARLCVSLVRDRHNQPQYFTSVVEDITDRMEAECALRDSERRLALAQSAAHLGLWDWDLRTNSHTNSGDYLQLYGLSADHPPLTYEEWLRMIHPEDLARVQSLVRESIEKTHVWDSEFRLLWPDGTVHWLLGKGTVFLDDSGRPERITGINLDITDRKEAEAALRASERQYREIFENISVCMFLLDVTPDGRFKIAGFNPAEEKAVGLSNGDVTGRFVEEVFAEELAQKLTANYRRCLEAGTPIQYDDELNLPGGRRHFHSNLIPMRTAAGRIHRIVGVCIDDTDRKQAEDAVRQSLDEIAHLDRVAAMGELAASLAHELNQPLAAILLNSQAASRFLSARPPDLARVRACLEDIAADDERAGEVIQRLQGLLKKGESQASLVYLNEVVRDALRLLGNDALLRQVSVKFEPLSSLPPVLGNRIQLYQVTLNLVVNALDAAADRPPGDRWVLVRTVEADGGGIELTVADSGRGIAGTDLARVFEPFFTTKPDGLGMGLAISKSIVQAHRGRIWAENRPGSGAIFRCVLPVARHAAATSTGL